jgi:L-alanine-DL-glutamate epimerase-like enolase superfamily enzyme
MPELSATQRAENAVNTYSRPAQLKITDLRLAVVAANYDYPLIRIDTNQGIYGLGEVRDAGHKENALQFKSMLVGQNPCNIDMLFSAIKPFGNWGREGGGVSGIEIALWDLIGKAYGVPCWQFLGGKYRDRVRIYADTPQPQQPTPEGYAERVKKRADLGLTMIKFDVGIHLLRDVPGALIGSRSPHDLPLGHAARRQARGLVGAQVTDRGLERMREIVAAVRQAVGPDLPLAIDHFGPIAVKDAIRIDNALEPYSLSWLEDMLPWTDVEANRLVTRAIHTPTLNGEDIYLLDGWREMIEQRAIDIIQPDLLTAGGMLETKKIADYAEAHGLPTVLHCASSPIGFMANVHCAAALSSFVALESHWLDLPFWRGLATGLDEPLIQDGYVTVPDRPGLGVDLDLEGVAANLRWPGLFEPTPEWDRPKLGFWQPDRRWDR